VALAPHCYGGAVVTAASVQLAAAVDSVPYVELDVRPNPLRDDILRRPLVAQDGVLEVPTGPGLGVELDRDVLERYIVERRDCDLRAVV
jgi:D-galactarolactone cycloisomerase